MPSFTLRSFALRSVTLCPPALRSSILHRSILRSKSCLLLLAAATALATVTHAAPVQSWSGADGTYWKTPPGASEPSAIQRVAFAGTKAGAEFRLTQTERTRVTPGEVYYASADIRSGGGEGSHVQGLGALIYDASGKRIATIDSDFVAGHPGDFPIALTFTAPAEAASVSVQVITKVTKPLDKIAYLTFSNVGLWTKAEWKAKQQAREDYLASLRHSAPKPAQPTRFDAPGSGPVSNGSLSVGKFYRYSRAPHSDYADRLPSRWSDGVTLTDEPREPGSQVAWAGSEPVVITIDLGRVQALQQLQIEGLRGDAFVAPRSVLVQTQSSTDEGWSEWQKESIRAAGSSRQWQLTMKGRDRLCRYVQIVIQPDARNANELTSVAHLDLSGLIKSTWKSVPTDGALHGAFPTSVGFDEQTLQGRRGMVVDLYEQMVGKKLSMVLWYQKLAEGRPFAEIQRFRDDELSRDYYGTRYLSLGWEPEGTLQIANGDLDPFLEKYFRDSIDPEITRGNTDPIWFRPMGEFNGGWVPYGLDPENFRRAWRRLYNIAEQTGALDTHILVWAPNHLSFPDSPENQVENYWPGDQYVDWVGISSYPMSAKFAKTEDSYYPVENIARIYNRYAGRKPLMIVEGGFNDIIDRERYVREWFDGLKEKRPEVKIVVWENHNQRVISRSPEALEIYRELVQDPYWISESWSGKEE